jgi:hypothetical protein
MVCRTSRGLSCSSFWIWIWTDHVTWRCVSCCAGTTRCVSSMCFQNSRGTQGARKFKWNFTGGKKRAIRRHEKLQIPKPANPTHTTFPSELGNPNLQPTCTTLAHSHSHSFLCTPRHSHFVPLHKGGTPTTKSRTPAVLSSSPQNHHFDSPA